MFLRSFIVFSLCAICCSAVPNQLSTLFRLYNPKSGDHFYTADFNEAHNAARIYKYTPEGTIGKIVPYSSDPNCASLTPIYRSLHASNHFYTTSDVEAVSAAGLGYISEGISGYCSPTQGTCGAHLRVHRFYFSRGDHFYTTNEEEANNVKSGCCGAVTYEGVMCYIW